MLMKRTGVFLLLASLGFSCTIYRLSKRDLAWQPYKVNDLLIFESSKGEIDSIKINGVEKYSNPDDPLDVFPNNDQTLFVSVVQGSILRLDATKDGSYIKFELQLRSKFHEYVCDIPAIALGRIGKQEVVVFNGTEAFKVEVGEKCYFEKNKPQGLLYIYWSKKYGYVGLEFKDGYVWRLRSLTRSGNNLL